MTKRSKNVETFTRIEASRPDMGREAGVSIKKAMKNTIMISKNKWVIAVADYLTRVTVAVGTGVLIYEGTKLITSDDKNTQDQDVKVEINQVDINN